MGMVGMFRRLSDADLGRLREQPELVQEYLADEPPAGFGPFAELDVDKAWHAIHFLLTGSAWEGEPPLNFVASGGAELGEDLGYGPARALAGSEVRDLAAALERLPVDTLMQRFDAAALADAEIYPDIWARSEEEDDTRGWIAETYAELRTFVIAGAAKGEALLMIVT